MSDVTPWPVGTKVAWFNPYDRVPSATAEVEKVYKTGHLIIQGRRFRQWNNDSAHETGEGYSKCSVRLWTPELEADVLKAKKTKMIRKLGEWLQSCNIDKLPEDAVAALIKVMKAEKADTKE